MNQMNKPTHHELIEDYLNYYQHSKHSQNMRKSSLAYFFQRKYYGYIAQNWKQNKLGHIFDITTKELKNYFLWLKNLENLSIQTKRNKWAILTSFLNFTMEDFEEFLIKIPTRTVNWLGSNGNGKKEKEILTFEEIEQILQYLKPRNLKHYLIIRLLLETGMRKGELINAEYTSLNTEKRYIKSKGKRDEVVYYFSKDLAKWLKIYCTKRRELNIEDKTLFLTNRFHKYSDRTFNLILQRTCKKIGIEKQITCHCFRRTINTYRKTKLNCNLEDRKILLNHKVRDVNTNNYIQLDYIQYLRLYDTFNPYKELNL